MWDEWRKSTAEFVTALLICGFCGRGSLGEHPPAKGASSVWQHKYMTRHPFASNPFLAKFVGTSSR